MILTAAEHETLSGAIAAAEMHTSGEVYCVVARRSDSYLLPSAFVVTAIMLVVSLGVAAMLEWYWIVLRPSLFVAVQLAALAGIVAVLWFAPGLRIRFVPRALRYRRAHMMATSQFLSRNIHRTTRRTGVLIFVSLAERYAEIVADAGINDRVPQERWNEMVAVLIDEAAAGRLANGLERTIEAVGMLLAAEFPPDSLNENELDDHVAEI